MTRRHPLTPNRIDQLTDHLARIPALYDQLPTIDEPDRPDPGDPNDQGKTSHKPGSSAPLNLTAVHLTDHRTRRVGWWLHNPDRQPTIARFGTQPSLLWWTEAVTARAAAQNVDLNPPARLDVPSLLAWLTDARTFILAQPWAGLYADDIAELHQRLEQASTGRGPEFVPRCDQCALNGRVVKLEPRDEESWWKCPACNEEFTPKTAGDLARRQPPLPADEVAAAAGISPATIRTWKARRLIAPAKHDHGRPLYHLADVLRVKERVRDRSHHRRDHR